MIREWGVVNIAEFLEARLFDDEVAAWARIDAEVENLRRDGMPNITRADLLHMEESDAWRRPILEWDAKRALSKLHSPGDYRGQLTCNDCGDWWDGSPVDFPCNTIKIVASVYKGHPDYQKEWAPDV